MDTCCRHVIASLLGPRSLSRVLLKQRFVRRQLRASLKRRLFVGPPQQHTSIPFDHAIAAKGRRFFGQSQLHPPRAERFGMWSIVLGAKAAPQSRHDSLPKALPLVLPNLIGA
jgi:hypothetical protein